MKFRLSLFTMTLLACFAFATALHAQEATTVKGDSNAGELNSAVLDNLVVMHQNNQERIFVIARLGRGETSSALNLQRLHSARDYVVKTRGVNPDQIVFASGERINGEGRLEFYLGSKLQVISLAPRGKNVTLVCCLDTETPKPKKRKG